MFLGRCDFASEGGLLFVRTRSLSCHQLSQTITNKMPTKLKPQQVLAHRQECCFDCCVASCVGLSVTHGFFLESRPCTLCHRQVDRT